MKMLTLRVLSGLFLTLASAAQGFTNLNFENGTVVTNDSNFGFLDWNVAVPGWNHSSGVDTSSVYYGQAHIGGTQWFMLADRDIPPLPFGQPFSPAEANQPLANRFSMILHSGYLDSNFPLTWVNAYISQSGLIPVDALSVRLLAAGAFTFLVNETPLTFQSLGGNLYGADISAFAGTNVEIKIKHAAPVMNYSYVSVDNVNFSVLAVPEPTRTCLVAFAVSGVLLRRRRCDRKSASHALTW